MREKYSALVQVMKKFTVWFVAAASVTLWSTSSQAVSTCSIGLLDMTAITDASNSIVDAEWSDASVLVSDGSCLDDLNDPPVGDRPVTVRSKSYSRSGARYYALLFEVHDTSSTGPAACGNRPCIGEKIILQFNPTINGDEKLQSDDRRIELTHKWAQTGSTISGTLTAYQEGTHALCTGPVWEEITGAVSVSTRIQNDLAGGGYRAVIEVPAAFLGSPPGDIGVAFAVINDWGGNEYHTTPVFECGTDGTCNASGASFPSSMPIQNLANPIVGTSGPLCNVGWATPEDWGFGYIHSPASDVRISRLPHWVHSEAIQVFACGHEEYGYYKNNPCRVTLKATVTNTGGTTTRNLLYLWAKHGASYPIQYNKVDLKRAAIPGGSPTVPGTAIIESDLYTDMPTGVSNHPCLRVYILPGTLDHTIYNEAWINSKTTFSNTDIDDLEIAYSVPLHRWAQKNMTWYSDVNICPHEGCGVSSSSGGGHDIRFVGIGVANAETRIDTDLLAQSSGSVVVGPGDDNYGGGGVTPTTSSQIHLSKREWKLYGRNNVIVQARVYGYREQLAGPKPLYNFIEDLGGVIKLYPVDIAQEQSDLPFSFDVPNGTDSKLHVSVQIDTYVPPGIPNLPGVNVRLDSTEFTVDPGGSKQVTGKVTKSGADCGWLPSFCCKFTRRDELALGTGVLLVGLVGLGLGRRRKR